MSAEITSHSAAEFHEAAAFRALNLARDAYESVCMDIEALRLKADWLKEKMAQEYRAAQDHFDVVSRRGGRRRTDPPTGVRPVSIKQSSHPTTESGAPSGPVPTWDLAEGL